MSQTKEDVKDIKEQLNKLQIALEISNENGLFYNDSEKYNKILQYITDSLTELSKDAPNVIESRKNFSLAFFEFNNVMNSKNLFWYRFKYSFGGPIIIYYVIIFLSISIIWNNLSSIILSSKLFYVPIWAFIWGSIGGILQGFWRLWKHVSDKMLRKYWFVWYFLLPLIGAMLGALTYLLFNAGFLAATGEVQMKSEIFPMLLSALAGFSCRWAIQCLEAVTTIIQVRKQ